MADLLFFDLPGTAQEITDGIQWFLVGWYTDNSEKSEKDSTPVMDWDMDQWRIYSAFRKQYGIDLNTMKMHFWVFMGLLTTLDECAFTRVADIRGKATTVTVTFKVDTSVPVVKSATITPNPVNASASVQIVLEIE